MASRITHVRYHKNPNGTVSYRARVVVVEGTMGRRKGENETLTGVVLQGQSLAEQIKHHASVRGFGNATLHERDIQAAAGDQLDRATGAIFG